VIEQAVKKAAETGCSDGQALHYALSFSLDAHHRLVQRDTLLRSTHSVDPNFILDGLHLKGTDPDAFLKELKSHDDYLRMSDPDDRSSMAILFHGPSGTGKSQLARHIAAVLDREIVFKRGSDLLSMWLGGTERNIKEAYEEAAAKDAILVFDEADSFLFTRDRAVRSWEISHTNEFLTWMEEFRGVQVFTTNRLSDLDKASLRRFNHKIEFCYLTPEGNVSFYEKLLAPLVRARISKNILAELKSTFRLAPGDFNVVRAKFKFKDASHGALISALKEEARVKSTHAGEKAIGF
jgi:transitional endoplasmic reticulum ATPase